MNWRERLADWISFGALTRARGWTEYEAEAARLAERRCDSWREFAANQAESINPLRAALRQIASCETPSANATVRRMAGIARGVLEKQHGVGITHLTTDRDAAQEAAPDWIWYGVDAEGKTHVSMGRWQQQTFQKRYKLAAIQPTEHDHPAQDAAKLLLQAGCSGVPTLTWHIRRDLDGKEPGYAPGDAFFHDGKLYAAVKSALHQLVGEPK